MSEFQAEGGASIIDGRDQSPERRMHDEQVDKAIKQAMELGSAIRNIPGFRNKELQTHLSQLATEIEFELQKEQ